MPITPGAETTCPRCWLDPLDVTVGQPVPREFGPPDKPVGVDCPACGTVYYDTDETAQTSEEKYRATRSEILQCLREDQARGERNGGGGSKGPRREAVPPSPLTIGVEWAGFPDRRQTTCELVAPMSAPLYPTITREVDSWLCKAALAFNMTESEVVRWALEWARQNSPTLSNRRLDSAMKQRRRMCILLRENEKVLVRQMADRAKTPRLGHYVAQLLDLIRRAPSVRRSFCALIDEGKERAFD